MDEGARNNHGRRTRVIVAQYKKRPFGLRWSTAGGTREISSGTRNRREAERAAAELERSLNEEETGPKLPWPKLRKRYEEQCLDFLSEDYRKGFICAANAVERIIAPKVISDLDRVDSCRMGEVEIRKL